MDFPVQEGSVLQAFEVPTGGPSNVRRKLPCPISMTPSWNNAYSRRVRNPYEALCGRNWGKWTRNGGPADLGPKGYDDTLDSRQISAVS